MFTCMNRITFIYLSVILVTAFSAPATAQTAGADTLSMSLQSMEKRFLDSNLVLLAGHYNVDAQKALIEQARRWDNPVLNTDQVMAANGKFFPYGKNPDGSFSGQYYIQIQQLIKTAGKRNKLVNLASTNARLSELQLQDVLRNLRYQLHTDYYTLIQQLANRSIYKAQIAQLNTLLSGMNAQLSAGNIAQKDYLRIQALVISLDQDLTILDQSIADIQADLKTILQVRENAFIKPAEPAFSENQSAKLAETAILFETAKKNNPYYLLQQTQTVFQQQNVAYQKALRTPDLTLGPNFDRNSSFAPNYVGLGISLPLPVFNKNQGNIKSAEYSVKQQQSIMAGAETELKNNISNAYSKWLLSLNQQNATQKAFYAKYDAMYRNIVSSYQQRQINLLEFLDFFNDYMQSQQKLLQQQLTLQLAKEELNYHTGTDILQ